jgi:hypothetical protein
MNTKRFKQLLESTMGDVRPLISEGQYLMEQMAHDGQIMVITLPYQKGKDGSDVPARDYFTTYAPTFAYNTGEKERSYIKGNKNKFSAITKITDGNETFNAIQPQSFDPTTGNITGKIVPPSKSKFTVTWAGGGELANYIIYFADGQNHNIRVVYQKGQLLDSFGKPSQK